MSLDGEAVVRALGPLGDSVPVRCLGCCGSTNDIIKREARSLPDWYALLADRQTGGRGRLGRRFFSPGGTGLYMSVLAPADLPPEDMALLTPAAAVAVCRALEALGSERAEIKWVNDVLIGGRKVCGILTEAGFDGPSRAVIGIGVNVTAPEGGFPPDAAAVAGAAFPAAWEGLREALAAEVLIQLRRLWPGPDRDRFVPEYQARSCLTGREVTVLGADGARPARVLAVDDRCRLLVRYPDGGEQALFSGEVSVRPGGA